MKKISLSRFRKMAKSPQHSNKIRQIFNYNSNNATYSLAHFDSKLSNGLTKFELEKIITKISDVRNFDVNTCAENTAKVPILCQMIANQISLAEFLLIIIMEFHSHQLIIPSGAILLILQLAVFITLAIRKLLINKKLETRETEIIKKLDEQNHHEPMIKNWVELRSGTHAAWLELFNLKVSKILDESGDSKISEWFHSNSSISTGTSSLLRRKYSGDELKKSPTSQGLSKKKRRSDPNGFQIRYQTGSTIANTCVINQVGNLPSSCYSNLGGTFVIDEDFKESNLDTDSDKFTSNSLINISYPAMDEGELFSDTETTEKSNNYNLF